MERESAGEVPAKSQLQEMLRRMIRIRIFETEASRIQLSLIPGAMHSAIGQEGVVVGACMALRKDDYMTGNHRSHGHPIAKGADIAPLMAELFGKKTGVCGGKGGSMHLADFSCGSLGESGIVGASIPAAVGAALSASLRKTDQVCLSFFGDGAANCGLFHESINLAAIWRLPVIFLCENNGYATCTAQTQSTSVTDIATRSIAYGIPGKAVDGQDVMAVYDAVSTAVTRARRGEGPTLVEAKTYRYGDHIENYTYPQYRSEDEVAAWRAKDPIEMFASRLQKAGQLSSEERDAMQLEIHAEVVSALEFAGASAVPGPADLYSDMFA